MDALLTDQVVSSFKIEKLRREQKQALKKKLRAELPVLNAQQIRRCRLPYHETTITDLVEAGYTNSADFIQQLFKLQEEIRKKKGPGTMTWLRPELIYSNKELDILSQGLGRAEEAHKNENYKVEWDEMLQLAAYFTSVDNWLWIGEQILTQCLYMEYPGDFQKQIAITNYLVGKFLIEKAGKKELSASYLETARGISIGKSWTCKKYLNVPQDNIFVESCKLLCTILLENARYVMKENPVEASAMCTLARKLAVESCQDRKAFEALILKGQCELAVNDTHSAIATLTKLLMAAKKKDCIEDICAAEIYLAVALLRHGKRQEALVSLKKLRQLAEENNLLYYLGLAYRYIGDYFLNAKNPKKATPFLMTSFYIFHKLGDVKNREEMRTLAAISAGQELYPLYIDLIRKCDHKKHGHKYLNKLVKWKDDRAAFWTKQQSVFTLTKEPAKEDIELGDTDEPEMPIPEEEEEELITYPAENASFTSEFVSIRSDATNLLSQMTTDMSIRSQSTKVSLQSHTTETSFHSKSTV